MGDPAHYGILEAGYRLARSSKTIQELALRPRVNGRVPLLITGRVGAAGREHALQGGPEQVPGRHSRQALSQLPKVALLGSFRLTSSELVQGGAQRCSANLPKLKADCSLFHSRVYDAHEP